MDCKEDFMRIGIIDADLIGRKSQRFPNLACMKISGYHKKLGDDVELITDWEAPLENYDKVYLSKVFLDTQIKEEILELPNVEYGGTGFFYDKAPQLPSEVEHSFPDYDLYKTWVEGRIASGESRSKFIWYLDFSIGFTTRGCIRGCAFCVNKNYRQCFRWSKLEEFYDPSRKYICLLDDNVLSCKDWKEIFEELRATGRKVHYKQGMDERLLTEEKCDWIFNKLNWWGDYIFAFDNIKDKRIVMKKLDLIRSMTNKTNIKFYLFCGFNHDAPDTYPEDFWAKDIEDLFERVKILFSYKCLPYVMRYKDYELSPYRGMYIAIAGWCNQPNMVKKKTFREFAYAKLEDGNRSVLRYLREFEAKHPEIARKYYDMRWGEEL